MFCTAPIILALAQGSPTPLNDKSNAELFLSAFETFLGVAPDDGRFGISRLPTIHRATKIADASEIHFKYMREQNYVAAFTFGRFDQSELRYSTMPSYYKLDFPDSWYTGTRDGYNKESDIIQVTAKSVATEHFKSKRKDQIHKFKYSGHDALMYTKKVFATNEKCLTCHTEVKKGQPIGIIGLIQVPKD